MQLFSNNASTTLASSITSGATSLSVASGAGAKFPTISADNEFFLVTITSADGTTQEIVRVSARSTDTFTIARAQEGTTAAAFSAGASVKLYLTAGPLATIMNAVYNVALQALATLTPAADQLPYFTGGDFSIIVVATGALMGATSVPVAPLELDLPSGTVLDFGGGKTATLSVDASIDDETLTTDPLPQDLNAADECDLSEAAAATTTLTEFIRTLLDDADEGEARATLGLGTAATHAATDFDSAGAASAAAAAALASAEAYTDAAIAGAAIAHLDDVGDVNAPSPSDLQALAWDAATSKWIPHTIASSAARATVTKTTGSLADGATENSTVTLAKTTALLQIAADRACWIRLYQTAADRTADASRALGTPASSTTNILAEYSFAGAGTIARLPALLTNGDGSPTSSIYYAITNKSGATHTVQIQFLHLALEN